MFLGKRGSVKNTLGFTLIEVLVVFGLMVIMATVSVSFYNNFRAKEGVRSSVSALVSRLRLARQRAILVQKLDDECSDLDYWWIDVGSGILTTGYRCDTNEDYDFGDSFEIPSDVTVATNVGSFPIKFDSLTGSNSAGLVTVDVSSDSSSVPYQEQVGVDSLGVINEP